MNNVVVLVLVLLYWLAVARGINVALHGQVNPEEFIVGSAVTCAGMESAFLHLGAERTRIFYPFHYDGLAETGPRACPWDLIVIEGWTETVPSFIHETRRLNPDAVVFFFCLDPAFPGLETLKRLDVDGYLSNSDAAVQELGKVAPAVPLFLAVDTETFRPDFSEKYAWLATRPVFVGSILGMTTKRDLRQMLREAVPYGLVVYGKGWEVESEFAHLWRGVLPLEDLQKVYSSAMAVIGTTMDAQRDMGMINNRVFEVLASGGVLISDDFPALRRKFGGNIMYHSKPGDTAAHLQALSSEKVSRECRAEVIKLIRERDTWKERVKNILAFYDHILHLRTQKQLLPYRFNYPRIAVLSSSPRTKSSGDVAAVLSAAIRKLHFSKYNFAFCNGALQGSCDDFFAVPKGASSCAGTIANFTDARVPCSMPFVAGGRVRIPSCDACPIANDVSSEPPFFDFVLVRDEVCGSLDRVVRTLPWLSRKSLRAKVLLVTDARMSFDCGGDIKYDLLVHRTGIASHPPDSTGPVFFRDIWHKGAEANLLPVALSRALCFGAGPDSSIVRISEPQMGSVVPYADLFDVEYTVENFAVRRDGGVCVYVAGDVANETTMCVFQPDAVVRLNFTTRSAKSENIWRVNITMTLVSNMYGHAVARTESLFEIATRGDGKVSRPALSTNPRVKIITLPQIALAG